MSKHTLLTKRGAARLLGVSERTIDRMVKRGDIPRLKFGPLVRFDEEAVLKAGEEDANEAGL